MRKTNRPFEAKQLRTRYRTWELIATKNTVTGKKGGEHFEIARLAGFQAALEAGKRKIDRLEGPEVWDQDYTNGALR